ncbi:DNA primase [Patescibacteria group bacterium]|nr:DNA primase [Patescibacteria group bacterium]
MPQANSSIQEIKDRLNIVDVLSSYIQLKKAGTNYKATCPFHHEKTASLMVSPSKQIWHCFGCGEGGDIFGFMMKYENVDFPEALRMLAERAGVELPKFTRENAAQEQYKDKLYRINGLAARFYHETLMKSHAAEAARKYLQQRGLTQSTLRDWQIGYSPSEFHVLENFMLKKGFSLKELVDAGVSSKSPKGDVYDRFFGRITFPIVNYSGETAGFTARILDDSAKAAKYVNSPETQVYSKGRVIFGLYQAKQEIRKQDSAIVVEGNMDVITAHQAGFKNVVASSGTAFTYEQLQMLARLTKNLKFAFDTDAAGATATRRALESALQLGFTVYILNIKNAKDPDELIKKDPKLFAEAAENAPLYLDYFFEKSFENYDPTSVQQKKTIAASLVPLLRQLSDPLEAAHYIRLLSQRLNTPEKTVYELIARQKVQTPQRAAAQQQPAPLVKPKSFQLEQKILGYALFRPEYAREIFENCADSDFLDAEPQQVIVALRNKPAEQSEDEFIAGLHEQELAKLALFMVESEYHQLDNPAVFDKQYRQTLREFVTNNVKIAMKSVMTEMALAEQKKDKEKINELNKKFLELSKNLTKF